MNGQWSAESLAAQALGDVDAASGAITPAIHPSTSYERNPDGTYRSGLAYTRSDNPTYDHAEKLLTTLESGASCMLFASGSAAATAVFQALLPGDHVLVSRDRLSDRILPSHPISAPRHLRKITLAD